MKNYYDELNLKKNATASEIKSAFKKMAKEYHPDSNSGGDAEKFKTINEAYQILNDAPKKAEYDINESGITKEVEKVKRRKSKITPLLPPIT